MENLEWKEGSFEISTDKAKLQVDRIHQFLSKESYWAKGIPRDIVEKSIKNSLCFGLFHITSDAKAQIGFARVVTDGATFAWLCDVFVQKEFRGQGLSKWLVEKAVHHPELSGLKRFCLVTKDAQSLYARFGFEPTRDTNGWMEIFKPYQK